MNRIDFVGESLLTSDELDIANKLFSELFLNIQHQIKQRPLLKVYFKEHKKQGINRKMTIEIEVIFPGRTFKAKAFDWDFARAVHKAANKLVNEIEHKFHVSNQNRKE